MKKLVLLLATLLIVAGTYIMIINQGVSFIKRMEGCQLIAYQDIGGT
jgi:hypothetical protein